MCAAYGAASASGATAQAGTSQLNSITRRVGRCENVARRPASESRAIEPCCGPAAGAGRAAMPNRSTSPDAATATASMASAPRGGMTASSKPPAPYAGYLRALRHHPHQRAAQDVVGSRWQHVGQHRRPDTLEHR